MTAHLRMLGDLRLVREGDDVMLPASRKARLLLAMLALDRRVHGRSELAGRLWPDAREDSARVSLRTALRQLRSALGAHADAIVHVERDGRLMLASEVRTDVEQIESMLAAGEPAKALGLWGELLAGFDEDWVHERRDELRDDLAAALGAAASAAERLGDLRTAVRLTREQTRLDPLAEAPHRELIRRLAAAGDRGAALSAYNRLRERLAHELRISPSPATRELIAAISAEPFREERAAPAPRRPTAERGQARALARARAVVGRMPERAALLRLLDPGGPIAIFLYGEPGVGKSALLHAFAADATARDAAVIQLDGETIEPSEAGFIDALGRAMGMSLTDVMAATEAVDAAGERVIVTVDACDRLAGLDAWLRDTWLPTLGDHVRLVIAGRRPPVPQWTARYGPLLAQIGLDTLSPSDAAELLRRLGVPRDRATRVNQVLRGHPLALQLAASTAPPVRGAVDSSLRLAIKELARLFLVDLDLETRKALETASVIRRVTRSLLHAMLAEAAPEDAMERLQRLPFVWPGSEGLIVFHVVRSVVAYQLRSEDPIRYRRLRTRAWRQLRHELPRASRSQLWRYGADILYLSDSPGIRDAFFPNTTPFYELRPAHPRDRPALEKITQRHEPPPAAELVHAWWQTAPEAFTVAQGQDDTIAAFSTICDPSTLSSDLLERDPVAATWTTHQRAHPLPNGCHALYVRHLLTASGSKAPEPARAALLLDLVHRCLVASPRLRRIYTCARDPVAAAPTLKPLGFKRLDVPPARIDGTTYHSYVLALGPGSAHEWLIELAGRDLASHIASPSTRADTALERNS